MKMIKNIIEYLIAIAVIPAIVLTVISVTELKDVRNVQYELLYEEDGIYNITSGTYEKLMENKKIKNYELESNYPLITQEEMDRATWELGDLKNEIYIDENGQKRIRIYVEQVTFDGSVDEVWMDTPPSANHSGYYAMSIDLPNVVRSSFINSYEAPVTSSWNVFRDATEIILELSYVGTLGVKLPVTNQTEFRQYLSQNPLTVTYELIVKNPNTMIIENRDLHVANDYVRMTKPNDFSNNPNGLLIHKIAQDINKYEVTDNWIYVYPKNITVTELASRMVGQTLTYELAKPRPVEVYDFSKFRLVYDKNRIRVIFDLDDGYYLWEITNDDRMIPFNGQHDLGNVFTVKFYVYEIQQPMIRTLVLLIPLIVISGVLIYMYNMIKKKGISY